MTGSPQSAGSDPDRAVVPVGTHRALGLTDEEYAGIERVLGRKPTAVELSMYAVMWSEHCSYKSSRAHLSRLPTEGPQVILGPGENAGVVDVGDGLAIALRIESHNHPSAIEPYQGAATGVGGILRDIFTMGARPIALMDGLFVGTLDDARSRYLLDGIVRGVAGYGNSVGVPTIGGQITTAPGYRGNPLVNVFCLGLLRREHLVLAAASGAGNLVVLLGSRTGRDGIGGVSVLASSEFAGEGAAKRPSVQVADPYEEKRLIEACLELLSAGLVVGIQDLGGAGLACATSETAAKGGMSMEVDLSAVPRREPAMSGVEVMTSESQERMLAVVTPENFATVRAVCERFEVEAAVIGTVAEPDPDGVGRLRIRDEVGGAVLGEMPAASLADDAPRYRRPIAEPGDLAARRAVRAARLDPAGRHDDALLAMLVDPAWIYRQYDHQLFLNTVRGPGEADAAVLRLAAPGIAWQGKGLALSCDANPGWCAIDPRAGTAATVAESVLNVACTGARPLALVNCLNFGNPEHPEVMWQLTEAIEGMSEACEALGVPVVGGNVSLYNASDGADIEPTPVVAVAGLIEQLASPPPAIGWQNGDTLVLLGEAAGSLAGSRYARDVLGERDGSLSPVDLAAHLRLCNLVAELVAAECSAEPAGVLHGVHDVADGGLAVALAEVAWRSGSGASAEVARPEELFAELPPRAMIATADPTAIEHAAADHGVAARIIGRAGGGRLAVSGPDGAILVDAPLAALGEAMTANLAGRLDIAPSAH
ncbi:MAG: phosphoribosylformylglycinamidine synthase subunit PurL [Actinomycetota bacterium]|jgi:phosphoribosylformylglycinamidine synthase|nr:phosphoribosylformylglycinamidine synthase subunit PurL [Actinomycetota bacterium]